MTAKSNMFFFFLAREMTNYLLSFSCSLNNRIHSACESRLNRIMEKINRSSSLTEKRLRKIIKRRPWSSNLLIYSGSKINGSFIFT